MSGALLKADIPESVSVDSLPRLLYVANTNMERELYAEAEVQFSDALQIKKDSAEILAGRGFCRLNQRKFTEAIEDFTKALDLAPDEGTMTRKHRAQSFAEVGDFDRAIKDMSRVVQLMPNKSGCSAESVGKNGVWIDIGKTSERCGPPRRHCPGWQALSATSG